MENAYFKRLIDKTFGSRNRLQIATFALIGCVIIAGTILRILPLLSTGIPPQYPVEGGGLYLAFVRAIENGGLGYPATIPHYTSEGIPFAYPPLLLYVLAGLELILPVSAYELAQTLPFIFAAMTVPAMAVVTIRLMDPPGALVATTVYAFLPEAFESFLSGQGLVESTVTLSFLLCLYLLFGLATESLTRWRSIAVGVAVGGAVMLGPGAVVHVPVVAVCYPLVFVRSRERLFYFSLAGAVSILISAFWWLPVISNHGIDVFLNAFQSKSGSGAVSIVLRMEFPYLELFQLNATPLDFATVSLLVLAGIAYSSVAAHKFMPFVLMLPPLRILGEGGYLLWVPFAILFGVAITRTMPRAIDELYDIQPIVESQTVKRTAYGCIGALLILSLVLQPAIAASDQVYSPDQQAQQKDAKEAFTWIRNHSEPDSRILLVTERDHHYDWGPVWSNRTVLNVYQGSEWTGEMNNLTNLNSRLETANGPKHVDALLEFYDVPQYDFIVFTDRESLEVPATYRADDEHEVVFQNRNGIVFERRTGENRTRE